MPIIPDCIYQSLHINMNWASSNKASSCNTSYQRQPGFMKQSLTPIYQALSGIPLLMLTKLYHIKTRCH